MNFLPLKGLRLNDYTIDGLKRSGIFAAERESITIHETHISLVFVTEQRAYKIKKPVKFPFLDYRSIEQRKHACEEEIRLNRRLAPDVYLGVRSITMDTSGPRLDSNGPIVDYCVEMNRLPEEDFLDHRLAKETVTEEHVDRLLDVLIPFYDQPPDPQRSSRGSASAITPAVHENLETLATLLPPPVAELHARLKSSQWQFLGLNTPLFESRQDAGKIVEGHGDLRPEHICLLDPPVVYDCVEFSSDFRIADILSELAFLAMECDFLQAGWFGKHALSEYRRRTGDTYPESLAAFYMSYRAIVRGKVELLRAAQQTGDEAANHEKRGLRYIQLASSYAAQFHRPLLFVMAGAAGVGKSRVAKEIEEALGVAVLRTDAIRQDLAGTRDPDAQIDTGLYSKDSTVRTYHALFAQARQLLRAGASVLLDGTFVASEYRQEARRLAASEGVSHTILFCDCPDDIAKARIAERQRAGTDISDARPEVFEHQVHRLRSAADLKEADVLAIDTSGSVSDLMEPLLRRLRQEWGSDR